MNLEKLKPFLDWNFYENSGERWFYAAVIFVAIFLAIKIFQKVIIFRLKRFLKKTKTRLDDLIIETLGATKSLFVLVISLYAGSLALELPPNVRKYTTVITTIVLLLQIAVWGKHLINTYLKHYREVNAEEPSNIMTVNAIGVVTKIVFYTLILLLILENLGIDVTALITGLGIGGVAVALAAQNILKDFFASITIVLDKPFLVGDFIIVGDTLGTIEHIGIKTTRIRSLSGEQIILCNSQLLESRIQNYKRMEQRRTSFSFGVTYGTSTENLKKIPGIVREVIESQENTKFDRAHFKNFGDSTLNFEVVYYVLGADYTLYMDIQQTINLELHRRLSQEGVEFAFPTRTLYVEPA